MATVIIQGDLDPEELEQLVQAVRDLDKLHPSRVIKMMVDAEDLTEEQIAEVLNAGNTIVPLGDMPNSKEMEASFYETDSISGG